MGQYNVAKILFEEDRPLTRKQIANIIGNIQPSTIGDTLRVLKRKEYAKQVENGYIFHPDATKEDLQRIKPLSIDEIKKKKQT